MIIWIIGLAGSGKTTIAEGFYKKIKPLNPATCILDGDSVRKANNNDLGYSLEERRKNAHRIQGIAKILDDQGINVIAPTLSNFQSDRDWKIKNYSKYFEVFVDTPMEIVLKRDQKNLYSDFEKGIIKNVVGCDIKFQRPINPDIILNGSDDLHDNVQKIYDLCFGRGMT
jgi:adenylyl-sulfate kinase